MTNLKEALLSTNPKIRNQALKSLYLDPTINNKVIAWTKQYHVTNCEPDDILQESIILMDKLIRTGKFKAQSKIPTFLLGICFNLIRNQNKKVERIDFQEQLFDSEQMRKDWQYDLIQEMEKKEEDLARERLLTKAFNQLDNNCQNGLKAYYFENLSMAQIAQKRAYSSVQVAKNSNPSLPRKIKKNHFK